MVYMYGVLCVRVHVVYMYLYMLLWNCTCTCYYGIVMYVHAQNNNVYYSCLYG